MRFIIFYNDHPKVKTYTVRVWHMFQKHGNFQGELTHPLFIKHYHIDPENVSSLGNIVFNPGSKKWELDEKKAFVSIKTNRKNEDKDLIVSYMNNTYQNDTEMINISLKEESIIKNNQRLKNLIRGSNQKTI